MPTPSDRLLWCLEVEETLLRKAVQWATGVRAAVRRGDLAAISDGGLTIELQQAAVARTAAHDEAAKAAGLPGTATLAELAAKLPERAELLAARDRLRERTAEFVSLQRGNANLVNHLRQYVRGVLGGLTGGDGPTRYGPTGSRLDPPAGAALTARG